MFWARSAAWIAQQVPKPLMINNNLPFMAERELSEAETPVGRGFKSHRARFNQELLCIRIIIRISQSIYS